MAPKELARFARWITVMASIKHIKPAPIRAQAAAELRSVLERVTGEGVLIVHCCGLMEASKKALRNGSKA